MAKQSLRKRLAWLLGEMKVVLVGPKGSRDSLAKWSELHRVLRMRPEVLYNHLRIRERLDRIYGNQNDSSKLHDPEDTLDDNGFLSFHSIVNLCEEINFTETLIRNARFLETDDDDARVGPVTEGVLTADAEKMLQRHMDDIANVRTDPGTFSFTSVSPSEPDAMASTTEYLKYVQAAFGGNHFQPKDEDEDDDGEDITLDSEDSRDEEEATSDYEGDEGDVAVDDEDSTNEEEPPSDLANVPEAPEFIRF
jgi:hypothetical protein